MSGIRRLLVVVDMQRDFVDGALGSEAARKIVPAVQALVAEADEVVYTQDTHEENYLDTHEGKFLPVPHCIRGTEGHEILPEVFRAGARVFEKSTFGSASLAGYAVRYDEITLCGVCTDICVVSNALLIRAFAPEAGVRVAASACAGTSPEAHQAALLTMKSCQIEII